MQLILNNWDEMKLGTTTAIVATITEHAQKKDFELLKSNIRRIKLKKVNEQKSKYINSKFYKDENKRIGVNVKEGNLHLHFGEFVLILLGFGNRNVNGLEFNLSIGFEFEQDVLKNNSQHKLESIIVEGISKERNQKFHSPAFYLSNKLF